MIITNEFIEQGIYGGTLNKAQCDILSQSYPPPLEWQSLVIGKKLSLKNTNLFILLRGNLSLQAQKHIIYNYKLLAEFHKKEEMKEKVVLKSHQIGDIKIYCDGACHKNPGQAGSGLAIYQGEDKPILLYGDYEERGTNNTAELNALYKALLLASEYSQTTIYTDSKYSIDCLTLWAYSWKKNGWKKKGGEIKNLKIIKKAHALYEKLRNKVIIKHVKGHSGVEGNELADRMAMHAITSKSKSYEVYHYTHREDILNMVQG